MKFSKLNRVVHRWGSILTAIPIVVIIVTGIILQLKKQSDWVQPPSKKGTSKELVIGFDRILEVAQTVPEANIQSWKDIDRLDVRPSKGMVKVRSKNRWEIQIDTKTAQVLQVAYRRSDLIESIHDGSFFHDSFKLWVFLPTAITLGVLWFTGIYLFFLPYYAKWSNKRRKARAVE